MTELAHLQQQFVAFLKTGDPSLLNSITDQSGLNRQQRASIYLSAYQIRLTQVLEQDHEMLGLYLGDNLFDEMVTGYLQHHPSSSPSLRQFGDALPKFLAATPPFNAHPILSEIAQFERLLLSAFDAPDAPHLTLELLQQLPAQAWPQLLLTCHPSMQLFETQTNAVPSWHALKQGQSPSTTEPEKKRYWLLARTPDIRTEFTPLNQIEYQCMQSFYNGLPFSLVCEAITPFCETQEQGAQMVINVLQKGMSAGWFSQFSVAE